MSAASAVTTNRAGLNAVSRILYGGLRRQLKYMDEHPEVKFQCTLPDTLRSALRLGGLYNPVLYPPSYTEALHDAVKEGLMTDTTQGFELLRHFSSLVKKHKELQPLHLPGDVENNRRPLDAAEKLKRQSEGVWAEPIAVPIAPSPLKIGATQTSASREHEDGKDAHTSAPPTDIAPAPATSVLQPGTLLLAHPILNEHAISSQVLLLLHMDNTIMRLLTLNSVQVGMIEHHNPFLPASLRGRHFTLAGLRTHFSEPPVPLMNILHFYPELPHATVLPGAVTSDGKVLSWSTHDDFPYIENLIKSGRAQASDFHIFHGQHDAHRFVMDRHIPEGIWIPVATTSKVILEAQDDTYRRSARSVWEKVMRYMGGDYAYAAADKPSAISFVKA